MPIRQMYTSDNKVQPDLKRHILALKKFRNTK